MYFNEFIAGLVSAMRSAGIDTDFIPQATGEIERFHINGDKSGSKNGWLVLHESGDFAAGCFGSWKSSSSHTWCSKSNCELSPAEHQDLKRKIYEAKSKAEMLRAESRKVAANIAQALWGKSSESSVNHPYLVAKVIKPYGIRNYSKSLYVPIFIDDKIVSLQFINESGDKKFLKNGEIKGGHFLIGSPDKTLLLCEGFATGASLHEATGYAVVVAFNAGNLASVAKGMKDKYPNAQLVICADNDIHEDGKENVGVVAARKAAESVGALLVAPELNGEKCDFNDLKLAIGGEAVKSVIENVLKTQINPATYYHFKSSSVGYEIDGKGVYFNKPKKEDKKSLDKEQEYEKVYVCGLLEVSAITRSDKSDDFGRHLTWLDMDGNVHQWAMPMELVAGDSLPCRSELMRLGLRIWDEPTFRSHITRYIVSSEVVERATCISKTGWHDSMYVLPNRTIGENAGKVIFQASEVTRHNFEEMGTLEDWKSNIASLCIGNSRLIFALSCAFAAPLLHIISEESGGFHLRGQSSNGKTTTLKCSASVWGSDKYIQSWRATANGLEGVATLHNDCFMPIDEISQVDPKDVGEIAYMLANGKGKSRSGRDGVARAAATWRTLFLSTGEISLADHMLQIGKRTKAGQEVRMADIPADPGKFLGVFDCLHGSENGAALSRRIVNAVKHNHGTAGPAFIAAIIDKLDILPNLIDTMRKEFISEVLDVDDVKHGQINRVANRFALVAVAGELATNLGITGWQPHDAENAVKSCFNAWLESRESGGDLEATAILSQVKAFFEEHGESRFTALDDDSNRVNNRRAGFSRTMEGSTEYIVLPEIFKTEICAGFNAKTVTKILNEKSWLQLDSGGEAQRREKLPGLGRTRCYVFNAQMWAA